jgi:hypothetical protein
VNLLGKCDVEKWATWAAIASAILFVLTQVKKGVLTR